MKFWWVNHNGTHKQEIEGGYIWCPPTIKGGGIKETYNTLKLVQAGDVIFSYAKQKIGAVGIAKEHYAVAPRPGTSAHSGGGWAPNGWMVPIEWTVLDTPFAPADHSTVILPYMQEVNAPLKKTGGGKESVYLAHVPYDLGLLLQGLSSLTIDTDFSSSTSAEEEERKIAESNLPDTMKKRLMDARVGQGKFRQRVMGIEAKCRMTGTDDASLLIASHIKPWKDSTNEERLDGHNGLFLAPHIDRLFDRGWISFEDGGDLLISSDAARRALASWGLQTVGHVGSFSPKQAKYLAHHRKFVYGQAIGNR
ncbi:HNH endonuclease [Variovorax sp. PDNC026]|uniref:HNH endonuclease n=1 Tax=Variovorax sp. PDNC026 TaxID=2811425 RepID=UPI001965AE57|nr:HNH endonuclease signature motif containing protein [Variovorax sp. PDNC026]QRY31196.1 HNH endonuclease [Variovorax sp. PDNC026]